MAVLTNIPGRRCREFLFAADWSALAQTCCALRAELSGSFVALGAPLRSARWLQERVWRFGQTNRVAHIDVALGSDQTLADVEAQMVQGGALPSDVTSVALDRRMCTEGRGACATGWGASTLDGGGDDDDDDYGDDDDDDDGDGDGDIEAAGEVAESALAVAAATATAMDAAAGEGSPPTELQRSLLALEATHDNLLRTVGGLGALPRLQRLSLLHCTRLESLRGLQALPLLVHLELSHCTTPNGAPAELDGLAACTSLESLVLRALRNGPSQRGAAPVPSLALCANLRRVTLADMLGVRDLAFLADNARLEYLAVVRTDVVDVGEALRASADSLDTVVFHGNDGLMGGFQVLEGLHRASSVGFSDNGPTFEDVEGFHNLADVFADSLVFLQRVRVLDLSSTVVSCAHATDILESVAALSELERLAMSARDMWGANSDDLHALDEYSGGPSRVVEALDELKDCRRLERLDLQGVLETSGLMGDEDDDEELQDISQHNVAKGEESLLKELRLADGGMASLRFVGCLFPNVVKLDLANLECVESLHGLERLVKLEVLHLYHVRVECIGTLRKCPLLRVLSVLDCPALEGLGALASCRKLEVLTLGQLNAFGANDFFAPLHGCHALRVLRLRDCETCSSLGRAVAALARLEALSLHSCSGVGGLHLLRDMPALRNVALEGAVGGASLKKPLSGMDTGSVRCLSVSANPGLATLNGAARAFQGLRRLWASELPRLTSLKGLSACKFLEELDLGGCVSLQSLRGIGAAASTLARLSLARCESLTDVSQLSGCTALVALDLSGCGSLEDVAALAGCPSLRDLSVAASSVTSLASLAQHPALVRLDIGVYRYDRNLEPLPPLEALFACRRPRNDPELVYILEHFATLVYPEASLFEPRDTSTRDVDLELFDLPDTVLRDDDLESLASCFDDALESDRAEPWEGFL